MLCYLAYLSVGWKGLDASVVTCFLTALSSTGLSRQKQLLRFLGVFAGGCLLGIGTQALVLPHLDNLAEFALVFAAGLWLCSWVATSGPRLAYGGLQMALAYELINLRSFGVNTSHIAARDTLLGIVVGLVAMWLIYDHLWATPSTAALRMLFIRNLRRIAELGDIPTPEALRRERQLIDRAFLDLHSFSDSLLFEPHVKDERDRTLAQRIRHWHPRLRSLCLIQSGLVHQAAVDGWQPPLTAQVRAKARSTLVGIADRLEGIPARLDDSEPYAHLQAAMEQAQAADGGRPELARGMHLNHALLIVVKDVDAEASADLELLPPQGD
jgi:multidrug resistance protein MdtO